MSNHRKKQEIIENYIHAYNTFDIDGMLRDMHEDVKFENISNGQVDLSTHGIEELKNQAEIAKAYFKERNIQIVEFKFPGEIIEIKIKYTATLAMDLPGGPKAGNSIRMEGKSIFHFKDDKIIRIQDIS